MGTKKKNFFVHSIVMNGKVFMIFALLSSGGTYYYKNKFISEFTPDENPKSNEMEMKTVETELRSFLEEQLEVAPPKSFAQYSINDLLKVWRPEPKIEEKLPMSQLLQRVAAQKIKRSMVIMSGILDGEDNIEDLDDCLIVLALIMIASRLEAAVFYLISSVVTNIFMISKKATKSISKLFKIVFLKTICSPIRFAVEKVFPKNKPNTNSGGVTVPVDDVLITKVEKSSIAIPEVQLEDKSTIIAQKKNFVSKLKKCDGRKIWGYRMMINHLDYLYAGQCGSKIPRLNSLKDQLF